MEGLCRRRPRDRATGSRGSRACAGAFARAQTRPRAAGAVRARPEDRDDGEAGSAFCSGSGRQRTTSARALCPCSRSTEPGRPTMRASQSPAGRRRNTYVPRVGFLRYTYSSSHDHWHLLGFQRYELRRADDHRLIVRDRKSGFCLTDRWGNAAQGFVGRRPRPVFTDYCERSNTGALIVSQGTTVGYSDVYPAHFHGQNIDVTRVQAGILRASAPGEPEPADPRAAVREQRSLGADPAQLAARRSKEPAFACWRAAQRLSAVPVSPRRPGSRRPTPDAPADASPCSGIRPCRCPVMSDFVIDERRDHQVAGGRIGLVSRWCAPSAPRTNETESPRFNRCSPSAVLSVGSPSTTTRSSSVPWCQWNEEALLSRRELVERAPEHLASQPFTDAKPAFLVVLVLRPVPGPHSSPRTFTTFISGIPSRHAPRPCVGGHVRGGYDGRGGSRVPVS